MPNAPIKDSSITTKIKPSKHHPKGDKEIFTFLDESTINPRAKVLLEELITELGLSKEVIADLAITRYRLYKDKV